MSTCNAHNNAESALQHLSAILACNLKRVGLWRDDSYTI